jgi:hypothetical protein
LSVTCTTGGGVDLNDGVNYFLIDFDWTNSRKQTWLEPRGNTHPILAADDVGLLIIHIALRVGGSSQTVLKTKAEVIRNEFAVFDNTILWGIGGGSGTARFVTRPSNIDSVPMKNSGGGAQLAMVASQFFTPLWSFDVLADPYRNTEFRPPVI